VAKLEARGERASAVVMNPTDYWEMATETLGTSGAGGWAFDAATGPAAAPIATIWGIPVPRDVNLPSGTALADAWGDCDIYIGSEFRIDVSSDAGIASTRTLPASGPKRNSSLTPSPTSAPASS
jgi:hypothetical protein